MFRSFRMLLWFALGCCAVASAAEPAAPPSSWLAADSLVVLEITHPKEILARAFSKDVVQAVTSSPIYKAQIANPKISEFLNVVKYFETHFNSDLPTILGKLTGGGITLAIQPQESIVMIVESEDAKLLNDVHEFLLLIAKNEADKQNDSKRVKSEEYRGVTGWRFAPNEAHAIVGNRLIIANKPDELKLLLDRQAKEGGKTLADSARFQEARKAADDKSFARLYVDLAALKQLPQLSNALNHYENPLAALLFAPVLGALRESNWITAGVGFQGEGVQLSLLTDGVANDPKAADGFAAFSDASAGAMPNLNVPRQIAAISLLRDLHAFYAAKDKLFPDRTSGLIFFENMMGIFFTGRDLTEEVLAETLPDVRLVVAEQKYDEKVGKPETQFPGFAIVMRMRDPDKFRPIAEEAWQKALGLVNFTRGQQALPGMIIDRPMHGDVKFSTASFAPAKPADGSAADVRFNFAPALAMPGSYLILSSTQELACDLIDALKKETDAKGKPLSQIHSAVVLEGPQLASILKSNREGLIRQNMVEKGNSREQAEGEIGGMYMMLSALRRFELSAGVADGHSKVQLQLDVKQPE
jgi:hypothetical protein